MQCWPSCHRGPLSRSALCERSSVATFDCADLGEGIPQLLFVLLGGGEAELFFSFVGEEEPEACVCHDAEANGYACFGRNGFIPASTCQLSLSFWGGVSTYCQTAMLVVLKFNVVET
jgi:hypothetical protein